MDILTPETIQVFPRVWRFPTHVLPWENVPVSPGVTKTLLGAWDFRNPLWTVPLRYLAKPERVVIPSLIVEEGVDPGFRFTLCLQDWDGFRAWVGE